MTLTDYLNEMEYAVTRTIESLWHEHNEAKRLRQQNAEDADDLMFGVGIHWDTYFGEDKEQYHKSKDLDALKTHLATTEFSFLSLTGTLLQYAQQGLSASFGKPINWPNGRLAGS